MIAKDVHRHDFQKLVLIPCIMQDKPMGILAYKCACGAREAFEYGNREAMKDLGRKIHVLSKERQQVRG
jgi:hypothetical protein